MQLWDVKCDWMERLINADVPAPHLSDSGAPWRPAGAWRFVFIFVNLILICISYSVEIKYNTGQDVERNQTAFISDTCDLFVLYCFFIIYY